jgi:hypothetical protein
VAQEGAFDEGADAVEFVGVKLVERSEVEPQALVLGAAFVGVEDEFVGRDRERDGGGPQDVEGGLVSAGLIAAQLGGVDADGVGESPLGHAALFADRGEAVGEVHGGECTVNGATPIKEAHDE